MSYATTTGPGAEVPDAVAVLDPKQEDCAYPYKELCGCGVGFKLIQALNQRKGRSLSHLHPYLDLVATAIGADIVPITGENRILAFHGLKQINAAPRAGFAAIIQLLKKEQLTITDVVFLIAPRINAAGRIEHGSQAVQLLMAKELTDALEIAKLVDSNNTERKGLDERITKEALRQIKENGEENRKTSVVYAPDGTKGVIGIVASRLTETYYRPTLVFTKSKDKLAASARSVRGFDVYEALSQCTDHIEQFGGHKYAAGLTMRTDQYEGIQNQI